jgi:hypothetical protein
VWGLLRYRPPLRLHLWYSLEWLGRQLFLSSSCGRADGSAILAHAHGAVGLDKLQSFIGSEGIGDARVGGPSELRNTVAELGILAP